MRIEESEQPWVEGFLQIEGYSDGEICHHINLLMQADYVHACELPDANTEYGYLLQDAELKWAGHEFLNEIRDPEIWRKTKAGAAKVGSWSLSIIGALAKGFAMQKAQELGLPVGDV